MTFALLESIHSPADLRLLARSDLDPLAKELREYLLTTVAKTGGHLSSNLGTVELTIALHYVFNTPEDRIVWDVGHQTYPHKILTGRREAMSTLRQLGGLSGFPKRSESLYDAFGTAHSSTSISAALGMAIAAQAKGEQRSAIAVIGDGAMTAGMVFEAMNNAGDANLLVILNDNDMSISEPVGAFNHYLTRLLASPFYNSVRKGGREVLSRVPAFLEFARRAEEHVKGMVTPGTLFEELGFNYFGPINGHDLDTLVHTLQNLKSVNGPRLLHVVTRKGQGYEPAEANPILYHGVSKFNPTQGLSAAPVAAIKPTFTQIFGDWLCDQAQTDERLMAITPAMREGSGLVRFSQEHPKRYFDVGIAEQHAVTFAAGLACEGLKPVVAIYSTFLQRAYDQLIHDVALQGLPVMLAIDRAGLVGADGATHAGNYDIAFLRCIPGMAIMTPSDERECRQLLSTAFQLNQPTAVRYPRGSGVGIDAGKNLDTLPVGQAQVRREGKQCAILAFGTLLYPALEAGKRLNATVVNMRFVKPLDINLINQLIKSHEMFVTVEDSSVMGGAGSAVLEALQQLGCTYPVLQLGLPDQFIDHGDPVGLYKQLGLDEEGIFAAIKSRFPSLQESNTIIECESSL
ncbi:MAG: 1-deoxy-D-xylulose-5-phosphate synthase [Pseudomonadota bacterium]